MTKEKIKKVLEKDLFKPVSEYLKSQGYTIYSEVKNCDITARKGEDLIIVELKTSLNITLLVQATQRQKAADSVYVAVPYPKGGTYKSSWRGICHLVKRLELGLILVRFEEENASVEVAFHPCVLEKKANKKARRSIIREMNGRTGDYNIGGSTRTKLMTAYRENAVYIACCLEKFGPLPPVKLKRIGTGSKTQSILSKNYYGWFEKIEKGIYRLHPAGTEALEQYSELAAYYREKIRDIHEV
ncbi:MAG: DUF2161 family putative PD-(D/E)XK-type phosphodiesterase [Clostridia bacterium]|nr:DUF2161 family putative PD-(D/E)XK-type phosphodiesterase [Clostridia bacterium]